MLIFIILQVKNNAAVALGLIDIIQLIKRLLAQIKFFPCIPLKASQEHANVEAKVIALFRFDSGSDFGSEK